MFNLNFPNTSSLLANINSIGSSESQNSAVEQVAQKARDLARIKAPHKTGALKRSIYCRQIGPAEFEVGSPLDYAWAVEFGSGVYGIGETATGRPIEPVNGEYLVFKINGSWVRLRYVLGQRPQPFLRPAAEEAMSDVSGITMGF